MEYNYVIIYNGKILKKNSKFLMDRALENARRQIMSSEDGQLAKALNDSLQDIKWILNEK